MPVTVVPDVSLQMMTAVPLSMVIVFLLTAIVSLPTVIDFPLMVCMPAVFMSVSCSVGKPDALLRSGSVSRHSIQSRTFL